MGTYYKDAGHLFEVCGYSPDRVLKDGKIGPRMTSARITVEFTCAEPDCEISIDPKKPRAKPSY